METYQVKFFNIFANGNDYLLFLKELSHSERYVPIVIGAYEANTILMILNGEHSDRPFLLDLLFIIFQKNQFIIDKLVIYDLKNGLYFSNIYIQLNDGVQRIFSIRPSDGISIAIKFRSPIFVTDNVLEKIQEDAEMKKAIQTLIYGREEKGEGESWSTLGKEEDFDRFWVDYKEEKIEELNSKLEEAIHEENYEQAAKIRDRILKLRNS
jgi:bifunctional DNase/RNase